ncbi:division/cell wall cluster transcriptional repressor MraZ [Thiomicrorhabdus indica]|nr:division/cell wall cluster transcriptional repressor MraZ [Thiomicrorhabdus indica]
MSFRGNYALSVDAKGRMAIPKKFRDVVAVESNNAIVLTIDVSKKCLSLYLEPEFSEKEEQIMNLKGAVQNPIVRDLQRVFVGLAHTLELDGQGRFLVPKSIQKFFPLEKSMVLVGQMSRFEIWRETDWDAFLAEAFAEESGNETTEALDDLVL